MPTRTNLWLGMASNSKTGGGNPVAVRDLRYDLSRHGIALRSERLTGALPDRLTHRVHILEMNGESYRLKQSKQTNHHQTTDSA